MAGTLVISDGALVPQAVVPAVIAPAGMAVLNITSWQPWNAGPFSDSQKPDYEGFPSQPPAPDWRLDLTPAATVAYVSMMMYDAVSPLLLRVGIVGPHAGGGPVSWQMGVGGYLNDGDALTRKNFVKPSGGLHLAYTSGGLQLKSDAGAVLAEFTALEIAAMFLGSTPAFARAGLYPYAVSGSSLPLSSASSFNNGTAGIQAFYYNGLGGAAPSEFWTGFVLSSERL